MYLLLTHKILFYNRLKFFIPPENSENINNSIDLEEKMTVGNCNREEKLYITLTCYEMELE